MSLNSIMLDDWSDYDQKKLKKPDANNFSCSESWEVDYLKNKIKRHHPMYTDMQIINAIMLCDSHVNSPHPREKFVACVTALLEIPAC